LGELVLVGGAGLGSRRRPARTSVLGVCSRIDRGIRARPALAVLLAKERRRSISRPR